MLTEQMPPKIKRDPIQVMPNGREIIDLSTAEGSREYRRRKDVMWERQRHLCPICTLYLPQFEASFEHEDLRSGGRQDDRIEKPVDICDNDGNVIEIVMVPYNFAVHKLCNQAKGSKRNLRHVGANPDCPDCRLSMNLVRAQNKTAAKPVRYVCKCGKMCRIDELYLPIRYAKEK